MNTLPQLVDPYAELQHALLQMLLRYQDIFVPTGTALFLSFAILLIAWFGIQTALGASSGVPTGPLARLVLSLAMGYALIAYYDSAIPGIGYSLPDLVRQQVAWLVSRVHTAAAVDLYRAIDDAWFATETPSYLDVVGGLVYAMIAALCGLMKFAVFFTISFGFVATAILIVIGPIFVPFFIVPGLDFLFWGWLRSFLVYAFYQVIAELYVTVWASLLLNVLQPFRAGFDAGHQAVLLVYLMMIFLTFVAGFLKVPSLTASIFAGRGGEGTAGALMVAALAATRDDGKGEGRS